MESVVATVVVVIIAAMLCLTTPVARAAALAAVTFFSLRGSTSMGLTVTAVLALVPDVLLWRKTVSRWARTSAGWLVLLLRRRRATEAPAALELTWDESAQVIDEELIRDVAEQENDLANYRTELIQLTGFLGAISAATVAVSHGEHPELWIPVLVAFAGIAFWGARSLALHRRDLSAVTQRVADAWELGFSIEPLPDPPILRMRFLERRLSSTKRNLQLLGARRGQVWAVRAIVVLAVGLLIAIASMEGSRNGEAPPSSFGKSSAMNERLHPTIRRAKVGATDVATGSSLGTRRSLVGLGRFYVENSDFFLPKVGHVKVDEGELVDSTRRRAPFLQVTRGRVLQDGIFEAWPAGAQPDVGVETQPIQTGTRYRLPNEVVIEGGEAEFTPASIAVTRLGE